MAEFVESTKYNSRSKLLQTNSHHAQIASNLKAKSYRPICFIFLCLILHICFWFYVGLIGQKRKLKHVKLKWNWNEKQQCKTEMEKSLKTETKLKIKLHCKNETETETKRKGET